MDARTRFPGELALDDEKIDLDIDLMKRDGKLFDAADQALWSKGASLVPGVSPGVEAVCEAFWDIEELYRLADWEIGGVRCWLLARMQIYYRVTQLVGIFDPPHPALREIVGSKRNAQLAEIESYWRRLMAPRPKPRGSFLGRLLGLYPEPQADGTKAKYAIIMATRQMNGQEPYTAALRAELEGKAILLDRPDMGNVGPGCVDLNAMQEFFRVQFGEKVDYKLGKDDRIRFEKIRVAFQKRLGVELGDIASQCRRQIPRFHYTFRGFSAFFKATRIKTLFLTNGYSTGNQPAVAAARALGIRVVELQHGFISKFHLGYSWPRGQAVAYAPNEIWFFGDFWPKSTPLAKGIKPRSIGAPYVKGLVEANKGEREPNLVVFTSQGVVGKQLFDLALETARRRSDKRIVFRLHPSESLESYERQLAGTENAPANFELSHRTPNIFSLLASTAIQVGAFSTTLFEGMSLGTRTVVIDLPGVEYMRPAIETGDVLLVRNIDELVARLDEAPLAHSPQFYYADPVERLVS
jgi:hypothetical protein